MRRESGKHVATQGGFVEFWDKSQCLIQQLSAFGLRESGSNDGEEQSFAECAPVVTQARRLFGETSERVIAEFRIKLINHRFKRPDATLRIGRTSGNVYRAFENFFPLWLGSTPGQRRQ